MLCVTVSEYLSKGSDGGGGVPMDSRGSSSVEFMPISWQPQHRHVSRLLPSLTSTTPDKVSYTSAEILTSCNESSIWLLGCRYWSK